MISLLLNKGYLSKNPRGAHSVGRYKIEVIVGIDNRSDPV